MSSLQVASSQTLGLLVPWTLRNSAEPTLTTCVSDFFFKAEIITEMIIGLLHIQSSTFNLQSTSTQTVSLDLNSVRE